MMAASGCRQVLIGLESPDASGLDGVDPTNWKQRRSARYLDAIYRIQSHGITVNGCFILGLDNHTPDVFERVRDFVRASGLLEVQVTVQTPFPNTPLYHRLKREGRLVREDAGSFAPEPDRHQILVLHGRIMNDAIDAPLHAEDPPRMKVLVEELRRIRRLGCLLCREMALLRDGRFVQAVPIRLGFVRWHTHETKHIV